MLPELCARILLQLSPCALQNHCMGTCESDRTQQSTNPCSCGPPGRVPCAIPRLVGLHIDRVFRQAMRETHAPLCTRSGCSDKFCTDSASESGDLASLLSASKEKLVSRLLTRSSHPNAQGEPPCRFPFPSQKCRDWPRGAGPWRWSASDSAWPASFASNRGDNPLRQRDRKGNP